MKKVLLVGLLLGCFGVSVSGQVLKYKDKVPKLPKLINLEKRPGKIVGPPPLPPLSFIESNELNVERVPQKANMLCWAACMEMIFKFHNVINVDQAMLASQKRNINDSNYCNCLNSTTKCPTDVFNGCNQLISVQTRRSVINSPRNFSYLFSKHQFDSVEDLQVMTWSKVKNQINNNHPFLAVILEKWCEGENKPKDTLPSSNHVVVVNGYCGSDVVNYLAIQDPWFNEKALVRRIDFELTDYTKGNVISYIHSIHKSDELDCKTDIHRTSGYFTEKKLCDVIKENKLLNSIAFKESISETEYNKILSLNSNSIFEIKSFSLTDIFIKESRDTDLSAIINDPCNLTYNLISDKKNQTDLVKQGKNYFITKIYNLDTKNYLISEKNLINIKGTNNNVKIYLEDGKPNFGRVIYYSLGYEFLRFEYKDLYYLTPKENYNELNLKQGIGYPEKDVLSELRKKI